MAIRGEANDRRLPIPALLDRVAPARGFEGQFKAKYRLTPAQLGLQSGDQVLYWAEAEDNREPERNRTETDRRWLTIGPPERARDAANGSAAGGQPKQPQDAQGAEPAETRSPARQRPKPPEAARNRRSRPAATGGETATRHRSNKRLKNPKGPRSRSGGKRPRANSGRRAMKGPPGESAASGRKAGPKVRPMGSSPAAQPGGSGSTGNRSTANRTPAKYLRRSSQREQDQSAEGSHAAGGSQQGAACENRPVIADGGNQDGRRSGETPGAREHQGESELPRRMEKRRTKRPRDLARNRQGSKAGSRPQNPLNRLRSPH